MVVIPAVFIILTTILTTMTANQGLKARFELFGRLVL